MVNFIYYSFRGKRDLLFHSFIAWILERVRFFLQNMEGVHSLLDKFQEGEKLIVFVLFTNIDD